MQTITLAEYRQLMRKERKDAREHEHNIRLENQQLVCNWWNETFRKLSGTHPTPALPQSKCAEYAHPPQTLGYESAEHLARAWHV